MSNANAVPSLNELQTDFSPTQPQYLATMQCDDDETPKKRESRILVDVSDDDLISCFVTTEQEATHDSLSFFLSFLN